LHPVLRKLFDKYPELSVCESEISGAFDVMKKAFSGGGKVLICGNGGSAADCEHIVGELMKGFLSKRPVPEPIRERFRRFGDQEGNDLANQLQGALPAISLVSHSALMTAFSNDVAADMVFAQQVYGLGRPGDVLIGISTSGNARNVTSALKVAAAMDVRTIGLTGRTGGELKALCDVAICVPWDDTPDVQERHLPIYHALCILLEEEFFPT
jgi:D-sedoheptulose 7-phosphate isomerase